MIRKTNQRSAIRRALVEAGRPLSPQEIADSAQAHAPGIGIATVYRAVKQFSKEGWLVAIELPGEGARYELAGKVHHHHFCCRGCERVFELPNCSIPVDALVPEGFELDDHEIVLYGRCGECSRPRRPRSHKT